ncbi:uncharacterized protein FFB20_09103 [Fusarium fujikuroi]|nr:uncharacterized protein FFB20_09103 [Fusarium fujikuroi]SCO23963.1 uncharacterized protein FFE2_15825 [Fusarium fujikuroi]SCO25743.1 uncharacterized protein FFC1_15687 [Fusarium fujikuroi]SCO53838.1 uncharacterized protein FFNC_15213 [Fusarium fujikuroi]SCO58646.1 uncharacterized protein FFMR_15802 [Fusarium fujikuroi]
MRQANYRYTAFEISGHRFGDLRRSYVGLGWREQQPGPQTDLLTKNRAYSSQVPYKFPELQPYQTICGPKRHGRGADEPPTGPGTSDILATKDPGHHPKHRQLGRQKPSDILDAMATIIYDPAPDNTFDLLLPNTEAILGPMTNTEKIPQLPKARGLAGSKPLRLAGEYGRR